MNSEEYQEPVQPRPATESEAAAGGQGKLASSSAAPEGAQGGTRPMDSSARLHELLRSWRAGLSTLWRRKFVWLALCLFTPGWLMAVYNWAAWPLARPGQLALVAAAGLALIALPVAALWLVFRGVAWSAVLTARGYTSVMLWALLGAWLPWQLIWWVIPFESATLEGVLAALRFLAADAIFSGSLLWLGGALSHAVTELRR